MAGQPWQERYNRTVRKYRTTKTEHCDRTVRKGHLVQDRDSWDRTTNTEQTRQYSHDGTARTGHLRQDSQDRSI